MSETEIYEIYGHKYTEERIQREYPYSGTVFKRADGNYRITYDCYSAMQLRLKQTPIIDWGCKINERVAFVFKCEPPKALAI